MPSSPDSVGVENITAVLAATVAAADVSFSVQLGGIGPGGVPADLGALFPASNFQVRIDNEIITVGSRSGDTFSSLTRGDEGTAAASHPAGASVEYVVGGREIATSGSGGSSAALISYDNSTSGLTATNVQGAVDETVADLLVVDTTTIEESGATISVKPGVSPLSPPIYASGFWYGTPCNSGGSGSFTVGQLYFVPFWVAKTQAFVQIGCKVATGTSTALQRLGVYLDTGSGAPGALLVDAGTVDASTSGDKTATITETLDPGLYWLATVSQTAAALLTRDLVIVTLPSTTGLTFSACYMQAGVTGALPPTAAPTTGGNVNPPRVMVQAA